MSAHDEVFERNYARIESFTMLIGPQVRTIFDRLLDVRALPGDLIEFGAYQGALSFFLGLCVRDLGLRKKVWMLDSFKGLPETDPALDGPFRAGTMASSLDAVTRARAQLGLDGVVEIRAGWFAESLARLPKDLRICLAHLDADTYASTRTALDWVLPRLVDGGVLVLDDYLFDGATGVQQAADEVLGADAHLHLGAKTQAWLFPKGDPRAAPAAPAWRSFGGRRFDVAELAGRRDYLDLAQAEAAFFAERARWYEDYLAVLRDDAPPGEASHRIAASIGMIRRK